MTFRALQRHKHVPDSSNHSLHLLRLFNSSSPEGHCGGNQLLDGSVCVSPLLQAYRTILQVRIATPPNALLTLPFSGCVHHLSSPDTLVLLKPRSRSRNVHIYINIYKNKYRYKYTYTYTYINTYIYKYKYKYVHVHISLCMKILKKYKYIFVIMNHQEHNNIRNGIEWVQTGHSTCTCTVSLHVIEL